MSRATIIININSPLYKDDIEAFISRSISLYANTKLIFSNTKIDPSANAYITINVRGDLDKDRVILYGNDKSEVFANLYKKNTISDNEVSVEKVDYVFPQDQIGIAVDINYKESKDSNNIYFISNSIIYTIVDFFSLEKRHIRDERASKIVKQTYTIISIEGKRITTVRDKNQAIKLADNYPLSRVFCNGRQIYQAIEKGVDPLKLKRSSGMPKKQITSIASHKVRSKTQEQNKF